MTDNNINYLAKLLELKDNMPFCTYKEEARWLLENGVKIPVKCKNNNLTDSEIIKTLECCAKSSWLNDCDGCPCFDPKEDIQTSECQERLMKYALDLINHLQAQNKDLAETVHNLTIEKDALFDKTKRLASVIDDLDCQASMSDDCIAEKQAEIIRLQSMNQAKLDTIHDLQVEVERLQNILICFMDALGKVRKIDDIDEISLIPLMSELNKQYRAELKAEAYKEFAERLKEKFGIADCIVTVDNNNIDNLVKEMVGEDKVSAL